MSDFVPEENVTRLPSGVNGRPFKDYWYYGVQGVNWSPTGLADVNVHIEKVFDKLYSVPESAPPYRQNKPLHDLLSRLIFRDQDEIVYRASVTWGNAVQSVSMDPWGAVFLSVAVPMSATPTSLRTYGASEVLPFREIEGFRNPSAALVLNTVFNTVLFSLVHLGAITD